MRRRRHRRGNYLPLCDIESKSDRKITHVAGTTDTAIQWGIKRQYFGGVQTGWNSACCGESRGEMLPFSRGFKTPMSVKRITSPFSISSRGIREVIAIDGRDDVYFEEQTSEIRIEIRKIVKRIVTRLLLIN